jgi:NADPH:quinone reductase-like Zn-dependent oxidoreductase
MLALILHEKGGQPVLEELPSPIPDPGEKLITLRAAALNHRDVWIQKGLYAGLTYPVIPGSDGAGYCEDQPVIINPGLNWGGDPRFQGPDFNIIGMPRPGTFAQQITVPAEQVYPMPMHLSFEAAAALPLAGVTAFRSVFTKGNLAEGERVLVTGIGGGVALWAMQFALAAGAEVWVNSSSDAKLELAKTKGAYNGYNYKASDWLESAGKAGGFDLIVDGAGGPAVSGLIKLLNKGGRFVTYGGTAGPIEKILPQLIFWKQLQIIGSTMGCPDDFKKMLDFVNQHKMQPVLDQMFPLDAGEEAYRLMASGEQFGKIILQIPL